MLILDYSVPLSTPSHTQTTLLPIATLFHRTFHIQTHNPISLFKMCPMNFPLPPSLPRCIAEHSLAARFAMPLDFLENLQWSLSSSFHASSIPHTLNTQAIFNSHTILYISCNICIFVLGVNYSYMPLSSAEKWLITVVIIANMYKKRIRGSSCRLTLIFFSLQWKFEYVDTF